MITIVTIKGLFEAVKNLLGVTTAVVVESHYRCESCGTALTKWKREYATGDQLRKAPDQTLNCDCGGFLNASAHVFTVDAATAKGKLVLTDHVEGSVTL